MKYILSFLIVIFLLSPAYAINYGHYENTGCGLADAFNFNFGKREKGVNFIEIKPECQEDNQTRKQEEKRKDKNYNEYETYKRMLDNTVTY